MIRQGRIIALAAAATVLGWSMPAPLAAQRARPMLEYETAARMRDACIDYAKDNKIAVAIAVYDDSGQLLTFDVMDGASHISSELAHWKAKGAMNYRTATADMAKWNANAPGIATFGGGLPLFTSRGVALGAIGVSGSTPAGDLACANAALAKVDLKATREER